MKKKLVSIFVCLITIVCCFASSTMNVMAANYRHYIKLTEARSLLKAKNLKYHEYYLSYDGKISYVWSPGSKFVQDATQTINGISKTFSCYDRGNRGTSLVYVGSDGKMYVELSYFCKQYNLDFSIASGGVEEPTVWIMMNGQTEVGLGLY